MNKIEQYNVYRELERNKVSVKTEEHKYIFAGIYYTDTVYSFGPYKIIKTQHAEYSKQPSLSYVIMFKNDRPLTCFDSLVVNQMLTAAMNNAKGKPFKKLSFTPEIIKNVADYMRQYQ